MRNGIICIAYVDDFIVARVNGAKLEF